MYLQGNDSKNADGKSPCACNGNDSENADGESPCTPDENDSGNAVCRPERCRQRKSRILGDGKADDTNRLTTQMSVFRQLVRNDKSFIFIAWVSQCLHEFYQDSPVDGKGPFFSVLSFYDHDSVLQGGPSIRLALNMNFHV